MVSVESVFRELLCRVIKLSEDSAGRHVLEQLPEAVIKHGTYFRGPSEVEKRI